MFLEGGKGGSLYFAVQQEAGTNPSLVVSKLDPRFACPVDRGLRQEPNALEEPDQFWKYQ